MTDERPENPPWYAGEHQQWDVAYELWGPGALLAQALNYVMRAGRKPASPMIVDVRKAIDYLRHLEQKLVEQDAKRTVSEEGSSPAPVEQFFFGAIPLHRCTFTSHLGGDIGICDICGRRMTRQQWEEREAELDRHAAEAEAAKKGG